VSQKLRELIETVGIKQEKACLEPSSGDFLDYEFDVAPEDFLEQAERDHNTGGNAALFNSITNAKRAIRCQIDKIIYCLGYNAGDLKIARKVELLTTLGFVAPRLLRKVDEPRNLLEHKFQNPSLQEVEDALDIATLFIEATNRSINPIGSEFTMGNVDEYIRETNDFINELSFRFDHKLKFFRIYGSTNISGRSLNRKSTFVGEVLISPRDSIYTDVLRLAVVVERERESKTRAAIEKLFDALHVGELPSQQLPR
jgi:hypothetical protein